MVQIKQDDFKPRRSGRFPFTFNNKQHKATSLSGNPELTTRTDYVNKYSSVLQTSSYMFMGTNNTAEKCMGVEKAHHLFQKTATQIAELEPWMKNKPV